jgi:hypothetical protein
MSAPVLLAAYAVASARLNGAATAAVQVVVSNRFRPGFADAVGSLRQFGLCVVEAGGTFDEVVARAWTAVLGAFKHGYYDTAAQQELLGRYQPVDCYLNDRRTDDRDLVPGPPPSAGDIRAALPSTSVRWGVKEDTYDGALYLHVEDGGIRFSLWGDTHRFPPSAIERCARDVESVVVEAAVVTQPAAGSALPAVR